MTPVSVTVTRLDRITVAVALGGELDIETAKRIEPQLTRLVEGGQREVVLDLSGVSFCDSSGAALFERVHQGCAAAGARLRLCRVPRLPGRVIHTLGVDRTIPCSFV
ncbi:STAS domain-containing protein [Streptomyces apocyni]|uniref:STAS domain-containing protein n=1 Tax=Streptomyces apocyni TaxID=2654677 RepID=UPI0018D008FD|nr:STAS domain-containing protein [Streptomyces apocyni]